MDASEVEQIFISYYHRKIVSSLALKTLVQKSYLNYF